MKPSFLLSLILAVLMSACSSTKQEAPQPTLATEVPIAPKLNLPQASSSVAKVEISPFDDPANPLSKSSIYFDFDSSILKSSDASIVQAHGQYISSHSTSRIRLEGNTDEKGGREYNLSLGQKRADAVKKSLLLLGVQESKIEAVSLGKEKPLDPSHNEQAWAKNRRVDIKYLSK
jgi:peptidoglycan-associated lipoprotein